MRGRASAEPIYSWQPLAADAKAAHDKLLERLLAADAADRRKAHRAALRRLAAMADYPQGLAEYYRRRIDAL